MELISLKKGYKKTVCPDGKYFHQNKLFFIFTLIIFSEHSYFLRKSQITPERKQRKKIFFNSICTPPEHPDSPQSLYLWAFSQFCPLFELLGGEIYLTVSRYTFVRFILHIYLILHFCVPRLKFLEPRWSQKHSQTYKAIPCLDKYSSRSLTTIL